MEVASRVATAADLGVLTDLAAGAIDELTPHRGGSVWSRQSARPMPPTDSLAADLASPDHQVVVGTIDDTVVGYGVIGLEVLTDDSVLGVISDLYTLEGARGVSVGEAMMDAMLEWARQRNCFGVDSMALPGDRQTKNFFESFGLVARAIVVHRSLQP